MRPLINRDDKNAIMQELGANLYSLTNQEKCTLTPIFQYSNPSSLSINVLLFFDPAGPLGLIEIRLAVI